MSVGIPTAIGSIADSIKAMADRTFGKGFGRKGYFDQAKGLGVDETLLKAFQAHGLFFEIPAKSRVQGVALMRDMLHNSKERTGRPGLWVSEKCSGWWATVPCLPRDDRNPEDADTRANDHFFDGCRYSLTSLHHSSEVTVGRLII